MIPFVCYTVARARSLVAHSWDSESPKSRSMATCSAVLCPETNVPVNESQSEEELIEGDKPVDPGISPG